MKIVHFSDWHGYMQPLPEADLYISTGDHYENYSTGFVIKPHVEYGGQDKWCADVNFRQYLGSPDSPIVCVRGNHDYINAKDMFKGCNVLGEFMNNELIEYKGIKITGHRGIPYICGQFSDEYSKADLKDIYRAMPMADIYVTHYPPAGILDHGYGLDGLGDFLAYRSLPAVHCFGHIHECGGLIRREGGIRFSNAACSINQFVI